MPIASEPCPRAASASLSAPTPQGPIAPPMTAAAVTRAAELKARALDSQALLMRGLGGGWRDAGSTATAAAAQSTVPHESSIR